MDVRGNVNPTRPKTPDGRVQELPIRLLKLRSNSGFPTPTGKHEGNGNNLGATTFRRQPTNRQTRTSIGLESVAPYGITCARQSSPLTGFPFCNAWMSGATLTRRNQRHWMDVFRNYRFACCNYKATGRTATRTRRVVTFFENLTIFHVNEPGTGFPAPTGKHEGNGNNLGATTSVMRNGPQSSVSPVILPAESWSWNQFFAYTGHENVIQPRQPWQGTFAIQPNPTRGHAFS